MRIIHNGEKHYFKGKHNTLLFYGEYIPDNKLKAVLVFVHGIFETLDDYENLARRLVKNNIGLFSFDYRGFGKSKGTVGYVQSYLDWIDDLDIFFGLIQARIPGTLPIFYLAYSMGSIIGLYHILYSKPHIRGLILAATGYEFTFFIRNLCRLAGCINNYFSGHYITLPPLRGVFSSHKNVFFTNRQAMSSRMYPSIGGELLKCFHYARKRLDRLHVPVLLQCPGHDFFFRKRQVLFNTINSEDKVCKRYGNSKHDIYKEVKKIRSSVYSDLIAWINARTG